MFQIDRTYIDRVALDSLQGRIWDIRQDHKDDPTLPKIENYGIKEEDFEKYLDKKQNFLNFKQSWKQRRLLILGVALVAVLALYSLLINRIDVVGYLAAIALCTCIVLVYQAIEIYRAKKFRNNPYETFIKALLFWDDHRNDEG